jgi:hypothetical protein
VLQHGHGLRLVESLSKTLVERLSKTLVERLS